MMYKKYDLKIQTPSKNVKQEYKTRQKPRTQPKIVQQEQETEKVI